MIVSLPEITTDAMCRANTIRSAFLRLGAFTALGAVSTAIANMQTAGIEALAGYCTAHAAECEAAAGELSPMIGLLPQACRAAAEDAGQFD